MALQIALEWRSMIEAPALRPRRVATLVAAMANHEKRTFEWMVLEVPLLLWCGEVGLADLVRRVPADDVIRTLLRRFAR